MGYIFGNVVGGAESHSVVVTPGNGDGFHASAASGFEIHGGVADDHAFFRGDSQRVSDFESAGWVGFVGEVLTVSKNGGEGDIGEEIRDDFDSEGVGFIGKDGERDVLRL